MRVRILDPGCRLIALALLALGGHGAAQDLAITRVTLYPAPGAAPIDGATILIRAGRIAAIGTALETANVPVLDGEGRTATAGLWNSHVHFIDPALGEDPAPVIADMLLRYGFTSVVDTGSVPSETLALAAEIAAGRLAGPRIVIAAGGLVYTDGTPVYLPGTRLPEVATPAEAAPLVDRFLNEGADGIKIFSGSIKSATETVLLPPDVIRAITGAAHARGKFVVAHPTNRDGLENAVYNGVDVLAHTAPPAGALGTELVAAMLVRRVALIPTLKLWSWELGRMGVPPQSVAAVQNSTIAQLGEYFAAGGEILFGTDAGYMRDYDTTEELELMRRAGLDFDAILATLTANPARRFAGESGSLEPGAPGDVVIFGRNPAQDVVAFADVVYTVRQGRIVHDARR